MDDNTFGGAWTKLKLDIVDDYLAAWHKVLSNQSFVKIYVDAFAGGGRVRLREGGERISGSAERALSGHAFHKYVFFEKNKRRCRQLDALVASHGKTAASQVRCGDANALLLEAVPALSKSNVRGVVFLDPFGLQLAWESLIAVARTETMDVWYLFPLSGFYRQAARSIERLDASKEAALDKLLGTREWRHDLYRKPDQGVLFGTASVIRTADALALQEYARRRLETIFPAVAPPKTLRASNGAPLYSLFLCVSNPSKSAHGPALRIARHLLQS